MQTKHVYFSDEKEMNVFKYKVGNCSNMQIGSMRTPTQTSRRKKNGETH